MMDKKTLRKKLINQRNALTIDEVNKQSKRINDHLKTIIQNKNAQVIALYYPFNQEVDVLPLIKELLNENKKVVLPKVLSKTTMGFFPITSLNDVKTSSF